MRRAALLSAVLAVALFAPAAPAGAHHPSLKSLFDGLPPSLETGLFDAGLTTGGSGLNAPAGDREPTAQRARAGTPDPDKPPLRVYVVVVDGLRPQEVGPLTPNLTALRDGGTWYDEARAVFPAETLPNHVAMMTGVKPERSGIIANTYWRPGGPSSKEYMQLPELLQADTLTTRLERAFRGQIATATVLSKDYLFGVFRGEHAGGGDPLAQREADFNWDPRSARPGYVDDPSSHAIDQATMDAFLKWVDLQDPKLPQFAFVNLGNVDRAGHADQAGVTFTREGDERFPDQLDATDVSPFRQATIEDTDVQIGKLVDKLESTGAWDDTVLIVLSDHGMDWGMQDKVADIAGTLDRAGYKRGETANGGPYGEYWLVGGGGSELVYVHDQRDMPAIARAVSEAPGVEFIATRDKIPGLDQPTLADLGLDHPRSPAIEAFLEPGWHSSPPVGTPNPLPGNHGHSITQHSALFVSGGSELVDHEAERVDGPTVFDPERKQLWVDPAAGPGVMSVAPTVSALFGIGEPDGGFDSRPLAEALAPEALHQPAPHPVTASSPPADDADTAESDPSVDPPAPLVTAGVDVTRATLADATYELLATNRGTGVAQGVTVTATVPDKTTFGGSDREAAACAPGAAAGTACSWSVGDLQPGESARIEVTLALTEPEKTSGEADLTYTVRLTATAQSANGSGPQTDTDESLVRGSNLLDEDAAVDGTHDDTNYGACPVMEVRGDATRTAFADGFTAFAPNQTPFRDVVERMWAGRLTASVASAPGPGGLPVGAHLVTSRDWDEGAGSCEGAAAAARAARAGHPLSDPSPASTTLVTATGPVGWDVTSALDTADERFAYNGFELRPADAGGFSSSERAGFHSSEAANAADRPRLISVYAQKEPGAGTRCVDADAELAFGAADRAQRIVAYVTDSSAARVTTPGGDACNGTPVPNAPVGWEIDDDTPDASITSLAGTRTDPEQDSAGDAGPDAASTRTDAGGRTFITVRLADPFATVPLDVENRISAIALDQDHDGYQSITPGSEPEGTCEPGQPSTWVYNEPVHSACPGGESTDEDDVLRRWRPSADVPGSGGDPVDGDESGDGDPGRAPDHATSDPPAPMVAPSRGPQSGPKIGKALGRRTARRTTALRRRAACVRRAKRKRSAARRRAAIRRCRRAYLHSVTVPRY